MNKDDKSKMIMILVSGIVLIFIVYGVIQFFNGSLKFKLFDDDNWNTLSRKNAACKHYSVDDDLKNSMTKDERDRFEANCAMYMKKFDDLLNEYEKEQNLKTKQLILGN